MFLYENVITFSKMKTYGTNRAKTRRKKTEQLFREKE